MKADIILYHISDNADFIYIDVIKIYTVTTVGIIGRILAFTM